MLLAQAVALVVLVEGAPLREVQVHSQADEERLVVQSSVMILLRKAVPVHLHILVETLELTHVQRIVHRLDGDGVLGHMLLEEGGQLGALDVVNGEWARRQSTLGGRVVNSVLEDALGCLAWSYTAAATALGFPECLLINLSGTTTHFIDTN